MDGNKRMKVAHVTLRTNQGKTHWHGKRVLATLSGMNHTLLARTFSFVAVSLAILSAAPAWSENGLPVGEATSFSVQEREGYTHVHVETPWPGADSGFEYALVDRNRDDHGAEHVPDGMTVIRTPVERVVTMSTTFVAGFEALDELDRIVGHEDPDLLYSEAARARADDGDIAAVAAGGEPDLEVLVDLEPDVVMVNQYDPADDTVDRIEEAGITALVSGDWTEQSPVGRMEWIYLTGLLTGKTDRAAEFVEETASRYERLASTVSGVDERPKVLINGPFEGSWAVPRADAYSARFIEDAGGDYPWSNESGDGSLFLDTEAVFDRAGDADLWINPGQWRSLDDIADERLLEFEPVASGEVYNNNRRISETGGIDYFESGQIRPDDILADLISIFHPELLPDHQRVYYHRLD